MKKIISATVLSAGFILGSTSAASAVDPTPTATITLATYTTQLAAYNALLVAFNSASATIKIQETLYRSIVQSYKVLLITRGQLNKSINIAFNTAIHSANADFAAATANATTAVQKSAALVARQSAVTTAIATRKTALDVLGLKPVKPIKQMKSGKVKDTFKADRLVRPLRPVKQAKQAKH